VVSAAGENVGELVMSEKEALNVPRRLEPLHDPLSSSGRLMGVFGPVIEALVLTMLDPGHDLPLGRRFAHDLSRSRRRWEFERAWSGDVLRAVPYKT
jgi:hypothetical protein